MLFGDNSSINSNMDSIESEVIKMLDLKKLLEENENKEGFTKYINFLNLFCAEYDLPVFCENAGCGRDDDLYPNRDCNTCPLKECRDLWVQMHQKLRKINVEEMDWTTEDKDEVDD